MAKVILHLKQCDVSPDLKGWHLRLYKVIRDLCEADNIAFEIRARDKDIKVGTRSVRGARFQDGNLHIIDDRSIRSQGVLNAGVAYLWEYWHLDPVGTKAFSSIGGTAYDPQAMSPDRAQTFARNLKKRYVQKRRSKYAQPDGTQSFPCGAVSVFFQGRYPINSGATQVSDIDMLIGVQNGAGDRPIIVKPHPLASDALDIDMMHELARQDPRIRVTDANVHDILAASAVTASINSTVALEGFMHNVPAILFGKSDFHHLATTLSDLGKVAQALDVELQRDADFDHYLAWYFLKNCVPLNSGKVREKIWDRFDVAGFPKTHFQ